MDIEHYALGIFVAIAGAVVVVPMLKPIFKISLLLIAVPLMAQILRRIFGLPSNVPAVCC